MGTLAPTAGSAKWLDNNRLVFLAAPDNGDREVYVANRDGSGVLQLTNNNIIELWPVPSPDGTKIAFFRNVGSVHTIPGKLIVINSDGSNEIELSDRFTGNVAWSPDGARLAFSESTATSIRISSLRADGTGGLRVIYNNHIPPPFSWGDEYEFPTPAGTNVSVIAGGARVTFNSVGVEGTTIFTPIARSSAGALPTNFSFAGPAYQIRTSSAFTAPIDVCLNVPDGVAPTQQAFNSLRLFHRDGPSLIDRTVSLNFAARTVCARAPSLNLFVLASLRFSFNRATGNPLPSITGALVDSSGQPLADVAIELTGTEMQSTLTDAFGNFEFVNLTEGGNYIVQPRQVGYFFTESSHTFINLAGENTVAFVGALASYSISGRVTKSDGSPATGVELNLDGSSLSFAVTDMNGDYIFDDLAVGGSYTVTPVGTGFFSPRSAAIDALSGDASGVDFVDYANAPEFVTVTGRVMSADGFAIPMARVTMVGPGGESISALSNPFGYYIFTEVRPGDAYSIGVKKKGSAFSTSPYSIYVTSALSGLDFVADPGEN
jgi:hypothetical protein